MKCPKCGFNSFEYYDSCKKCSSDLAGYKQTYSITSMVLPLEAKEKLAAEFQAVEGKADQVSDSAEIHDDIFSFDLPNDPHSSSAQRNDDPFNFDEPSLDLKKANSSKSEDNVFADLLESTSQAGESPFAGVQTKVLPLPPQQQSLQMSRLHQANLILKVFPGMMPRMKQMQPVAKRLLMVSTLFSAIRKQKVQNKFP